ncbi:GGDEF domain-containing protein, partial [Pantoea sp. SIMBA_072]
MDIDDFKPINDQHGHAVGDQTLVRVVESLSACVREGDLLARWGGDEFMWVLPKSSLAVARALAEEARRAMHEAPV